jgi:hypothetical protein
MIYTDPTGHTPKLLLLLAYAARQPAISVVETGIEIAASNHVGNDPVSLSTCQGQERAINMFAQNLTSNMLTLGAGKTIERMHKLDKYSKRLASGVTEFKIEDMISQVWAPEADDSEYLADKAGTSTSSLISYISSAYTSSKFGEFVADAGSAVAGQFSKAFVQFAGSPNNNVKVNQPAKPQVKRAPAPRPTGTPSVPIGGAEAR